MKEDEEILENIPESTDEVQEIGGMKMTWLQLVVKVQESNLDKEAKEEVLDLIQQRLWEDSQAEKGGKY